MWTPKTRISEVGEGQRVVKSNNMKGNPFNRLFIVGGFQERLRSFLVTMESSESSLRFYTLSIPGTSQQQEVVLAVAPNFNPT